MHVGVMRLVLEIPGARSLKDKRQVVRSFKERVKSRLSVSRASSAIWPAISTPVGPAPTTTKVSQAARRCGSASISAASNALRIRDRVASALSSDFTSGAAARHSSWPKYE